jgi:hypothetical protein
MPSEPQVDRGLSAIPHRAVLLLAAAAILLFVFAHARGVLESWRIEVAWAVLALVSATSCIVAVVAVRATSTLVKRMAWETLALAAGLVCAELIVVASLPTRWSEDVRLQASLTIKQATRTLRIDYDERTPSEVVEALRLSGVDALPGIGRGWPSDHQARAGMADDFFPLSHASNAQIVECNEGLGFLQYQTDEYGFNNPSGLIASRRVDVAVVGESHALGHCVPPSTSIVDVIRKHYPRTATFGIAGSRVISQLASFREYVEPLRPHVVIWFVNTAYAEPRQEADEPLLTRYFDPSFTQNLIDRQNEVDATIRELVPGLRANADNSLRTELENVEEKRFLQALRLKNVRRLLRSAVPARTPISPVALDLSSFVRSLKLAQRAIRSWDGRLLAVILPSFGGVTGEARAFSHHEAVVAALNDLGIDVVDGELLFRSQPNPRTLFALGINNHPNKQGHRLLGHAIVRKLSLQTIESQVETTR